MRNMINYLLTSSIRTCVLCREVFHIVNAASKMKGVNILHLTQIAQDMEEIRMSEHEWQDVLKHGRVSGLDVV